MVKKAREVGRRTPSQYKAHDFATEKNGVMGTYVNVKAYEKSLADYTIVENMTIIFERPQSVSANLVAFASDLIHRVIDIKDEYICIFFTLNWFARMYKLIFENEHIRVHKENFGAMHNLFQRIIASFFKMYTVNQHLPTELFTNVITKNKALATYHEEWLSIITNYEQGCAPAM